MVLLGACAVGPEGLSPAPLRLQACAVRSWWRDFRLQRFAWLALPSMLLMMPC